MKVECIDDSLTSGPNGGRKCLLVLGKVYEVVDLGPDSYKLRGVEGLWMQKRFRLVSDDEPIGETIVDLTHDREAQDAAEEERCWRLMRPRIEPGHCACHIPKELCTYHRAT